MNDQLPPELLDQIASQDLATHRAMLNIPEFARSTLGANNQERIQREFTEQRVEDDLFGTTTTYTLNGLNHRLDGPAVVYRFFDGTKREKWYRHGVLHKDDGPAVVHCTREGDRTETWHRHGVLHRENGPAISNPSSGTEVWYTEGVLHRHDGPALILPQRRYRAWYVNGVLQREERLARLSFTPEQLVTFGLMFSYL